MGFIQEAMLLIQLSEAIFNLVDKFAQSDLFKSMAGADKAKAIAQAITAFDSRLKEDSPQLQAFVQWSYNTYTKYMAVKAAEGGKAAAISVVGAVVAGNQ